MTSGFEIGSPGGTGLLTPERPRRRPRKGRGVGGDLPPIDWDDFGGGGGGDGDDGGEGEGRRRSVPGTAELGLGLGLAAIGTLFLVFLFAYVLLAEAAEEWPPADAPGAPGGLWLSTVVLAASSACMVRAARAGRAGDEERLRRWLTLALLGGALFLAVQIAVWRQLHHAGLLPSSNGYGAIFYALTGLHGSHVLGGVAYLALLRWRLRPGRERREPRLADRTVPLAGVYWHFMGALWLVLFGVLYLPG